jgi:hypothetical protein
VANPFTPTQFAVLQAAFHGDAGKARFDSRRVKTRTVKALTAEGLLYGASIDGRRELTPAGLRAYVDMCERRDADSGCIAYMEQAKEARQRLAELEPA